MSDPLHDDELDALLREVPLPEGFAQRLAAAFSPSDERLDETLRAVAVPSVMLSRLKEIPVDSELDDSLVDLPAPFALIHGLRLPTWQDRLQAMGRSAWRMSLATSWFVALSLGLALLGRVALQQMIPTAHDAEQLAVIYNGPLSLEGVMEPAESPVRIDFVPSVPVVNLESVRSDADELPNFDGPPPAGPVGQWVNLMRGGLRPLDDAVLLRYGVLGSPQYADDRLPELIAPRVPRSTGIEPPPVRGYDRAFFLKHRVFPPISPSANPKLGAIDVPLIPFSDVLSRLERSLADGRLPTSGDVRTEELLAAMDYRFPAAPAGKLAIRTAAGPSLFGGPEVGLLQVGVQAGSLTARPQSATHLVLAIDVSHTMGTAGRLELVQTAIGRLLDQLGPRDRLSLVLFDEEIREIVEAAGRSDAASIRALVAGLAPRGGTNLAAGIQQAASLAMNDAAGSRGARRLVLITDSQPLLSPETATAVAEVLAVAGKTGVKLDVVDLSFRDQVDPLLAHWAADLSGDARRVTDGRQLYKLLVESLAGRDPAIAHDARLVLKFNPRAVSAYRLIGHEANALADISPAAVEAEILAGEAATALVELWFKADEIDDLGIAELTWNDPVTGQSQQLRQRISRVQFAATAREMPLPLEQAAIAAQVGELLHGSHDVLRQAGVRPAGGRGLASVIEAAAAAHPQVSQRSDVQRLLGLVRQLERQGWK